jgi:pimeloyl-ACP methyl ester carboxylesterase
VAEALQIRVFGDAALPALIYLPGLHGDCTLITGFRAALNGRVRFVEITYPRTLIWTIDDYTTAIQQALLAQGINHGWLLGESFGSQPAWALAGRSATSNTTPEKDSGGKLFKVDGLILAGGFVRYPFPAGPLILRSAGGWRPYNMFLLTMKIYAWYHGRFHRPTPDARRDLKEFVARRTPLDRQAMSQRLMLIRQLDPRPIARECRVPVHYLAGMFDPLVPWPHVRRWLRKNCPGYRGGKTIFLADHNVLASAPMTSANQVLNWMRQTPPQ